jgi:hypothetical protein
MQKRLVLVFISVLVVLAHNSGEAAELETRYSYEGSPAPDIASGARTIDKETGRVLRDIGLKRVDIKKGRLIFKVMRYVYERSDSGIMQYTFESEMERDIRNSCRIVSERASYSIPVSAEYETVYEYSDTLPDFPSSAKTTRIATGEVAASARVISIIPKPNNQTEIELEETHFTASKIVFRARTVRAFVTGELLSERAVLGKRLVDYYVWWPSNQYWPCGRGW